MNVVPTLVLTALLIAGCTNNKNNTDSEIPLSASTVAALERYRQTLVPHLFMTSADGQAGFAVNIGRIDCQPAHSEQFWLQECQNITGAICKTLVRGLDITPSFTLVPDIPGKNLVITSTERCVGENLPETPDPARAYRHLISQP